ncbi:hypothetical protein [Belliella aquatica]|uniref:IPT/TIG domain-containing protein n=1 Tax=Belliella aquatica TaxID=1323734 RepID=A0ABQ1N0Q9_9BACT|nr:hypothetical protein [Belliella aquatica]MCH7406934.1 hypothetical protein [Belliella aquatica]GGC50545.1 hypothetical protein GCM10010993_31310 [Belliella aquatica]
MEKFKIIFSLTLVILLGSCDTDSEIIFDNPQFSPALIKSIDNNGVVFTADVFDLGSIPIEEYGFFYSSFEQPRENNSEKLSFTGNPSSSFSAIAEHSMAQNTLYYVNAYIKTSKGYVFSEVVRFNSKGSKGFSIESKEIPNPLYFIDTITVRGSNFSRLLRNYEVKVGGAIGTVVEANNSYFKFLFPSQFSYTLPSPNDIANFQIKILDKVENFSEPISFREPVFISNPQIVYNIGDIVEIKGDYLLSKSISITILDGHDREIIVTPTSANQTSIKFLRDFNITTDNPVVRIRIRDKDYNRDDLFTLSKD